MTTSTHSTYPNVVGLRVFPGISPEKFKSFILSNEETKAAIVVAFASGTTPQDLNEPIKQLTEKNIPIFLLSDNPGDKHGILNITYQNQALSLKAGAIPLQSVNVNHILQVAEAIQKAIENGYNGVQLADKIRKIFTLSPNKKAQIESDNGIKRDMDLTQGNKWLKDRMDKFLKVA